MSKLIAIDNGHGKNTPGKRCPDDSMREWMFNHATALYLDKELKNNGFKTKLVSDTETDTPLATRVSRINACGADMSVSIHANAFQGSSWGTANGIETFAHAAGTTGDKIAKKVQAELIAMSGLRDRGVKYNSLYMTRRPNCPAILCECGFMDNKNEAALLKSDAFRRKCATAICKGICAHYGVKYKALGASEPVVTPPVSNPSKPATDNKYDNGTYNCQAKVVTGGDNLNVRAGRPGTSGYNTVLGSLKNRDLVKVGYCLDNWFGVDFGKTTGFVSGSYVDLIKKNLPSDGKPWKNGDYDAAEMIVEVGAGDNLNIRGGRPGSANYSKVLGKLKHGEVVEVHYCLDNWFAIYIDGVCSPGFICGDYLRLK